MHILSLDRANSKYHYQDFPQTRELLNFFLGCNSKELRTQRVIRFLVTPTSQHFSLLSLLHKSPLAPRPSLSGKSLDFYLASFGEILPFVDLTMFFS